MLTNLFVLMNKITSVYLYIIYKMPRDLIIRSKPTNNDDLEKNEGIRDGQRIWGMRWRSSTGAWHG